MATGGKNIRSESRKVSESSSSELRLSTSSSDGKDDKEVKEKLSGVVKGVHAKLRRKYREVAWCDCDVIFSHIRDLGVTAEVELEVKGHHYRHAKMACKSAWQPVEVCTLDESRKRNLRCCETNGRNDCRFKLQVQAPDWNLSFIL